MGTSLAYFSRLSPVSQDQGQARVYLDCSLNNPPRKESLSE